MIPTHCIFNLIDYLLACGVVELPEKHPIMNGEPYDSFYKEQIEQALANVIWFREEKDIEEMRIQTLLSLPKSFETENKWQPELMKPYKLPEGMKIFITECEECEYLGDKRVCSNNNSQNKCGHYGNKQFAFLKQSKEQKKEESQDWNDWREVIAIADTTDTIFEAVNKLKSKFTIQRK